jgi:hypothetical protein
MASLLICGYIAVDEGVGAAHDLDIGVDAPMTTFNIVDVGNFITLLGIMGSAGIKKCEQDVEAETFV